MNREVPGPPPKRSDQRVRRNKDDAGPIDKVTAIGPVHVPELGIDNCHSMVQDFYDSLAESAQSQYYESSDWQVARLTCLWLNEQLKNEKTSAMMIQVISGLMTNLLVTEGDRRRARMEIERNKVEGELIDIASHFRERFAK